MSKIRYNKSKTYLLPLLSELIELEPRFFKHLVNVYMFDDLDRYSQCLYILHDFSFKNPEFTGYEHKLINNQYFVDYVDIDNQVLYIFKFPKEYLEEYNNLILGKYSRFGNDAKELILRFFTNVYEGNVNAIQFLLKLKQILFKDKKLREQMENNLKVTIGKDTELGQIISIKDETFELSKYIKK